MARPTNDRRHAEATFHCRALTSGEWSLAAIGPSEVFGAVIGAEYHDGVVVESVVLDVRHDCDDAVIELSHSGFFDAPAVLWRAHLFVLVRQVRHDMHARWVQPEKEGLAVLPCLVDKLEGISEDLIVHGFHAFRTQC